MSIPFCAACFGRKNCLRFVPQTGPSGPHFACTCGREQVQTVLKGLGQEEVASVVA